MKLRRFFGFGKEEEPAATAPVSVIAPPSSEEEAREDERAGFFDRMRVAVTRTRESLSDRLEELAASDKAIDQDALDELEAALLSADLGTATTADVLERLRLKISRREIGDRAALRRQLQSEILDILRSTPLKHGKAPQGEPEVVMVVGVNGTGKTTSIGKLAHEMKREGKSVLLCAADTFRAAATEQLEVWGKRTGTEVVKTKPGGDPSAVIFDGLQSAKAHKIDYVIVDTAGRLHTKSSLMQELDKMRRTAAKVIEGAPHETLLVMDATTGQNGLQQARQFTQAAGVTGIILTKLDGTAKGGVVVAISKEMGLPVRFVGVGEKAGDLMPFDPEAFVQGLFA